LKHVFLLSNLTDIRHVGILCEVYSHAQFLRWYDETVILQCAIQ